MLIPRYEFDPNEDWGCVFHFNGRMEVKDVPLVGVLALRTGTSSGLNWFEVLGNTLH